MYLQGIKFESIHRKTNVGIYIYSLFSESTASLHEKEKLVGYQGKE